MVEISPKTAEISRLYVQKFYTCYLTFGIFAVYNRPQMLYNYKVKKGAVSPFLHCDYLNKRICDGKASSVIFGLCVSYVFVTAVLSC